MELESVNVTIGINDWISEEQDKEFMRNTLLEAGYENGKEDGKKDGLKQGLEQGRKTQKEFIINLHKLDTPIEIIAKASNLSIKEVESILGI